MIPASAIIPTADRPGILAATLTSIAKQNVQPDEILVIDASQDESTHRVTQQFFDGMRSHIIYQKANERGAAVQRTQGIQKSTRPFIFFMDDDIILEPNCIENIWHCLQLDPLAGAANAMISNQQYQAPGSATRFMYRLLSGKKSDSYAGQCIGPAWNLLPQDSGAVINETEWLNTTCTLYRKEALPIPVFPGNFKDYSLLEDLALSLSVSKKWKLYNVRSARIFHDSQPGLHKNSAYKISKMELINRHFVMVNILGRSGLKYHLKLLLFELWGMLPLVTSTTGLKKIFPALCGKISATFLLMLKKQ